MSLPDKRQIAIGEKLKLTNNAQFVLSKEEGGRLVVVQLVETNGRPLRLNVLAAY